MKNLDEKFMARALKLARKGRRAVAPNPMVGAVIVKNGKVIGEGYHRRFGGPHAEVNAIYSVKNADDLRGATIYVTLEPCRHEGKTPPCIEAIRIAGITRVVIGSRDPFQKGRLPKGQEMMKGKLAKECEVLNKFFFTWITSGKPYVTAKVAVSADGFVAGCGGEQVHLTTAQQNREVHRLRADHQAIMVGVNTVLSDDPELTVRHVVGCNPLRIIIDSKLRIPMNAKILKNKNCLIVTTSAGARSFHGGWNVNLGNLTTERRRPPNFWVSPTQKRVSLKKLFRHLADSGISSVLVETGPTLYATLKKQNLIDELIVYRSKKKLGEGLKIDL